MPNWPLRSPASSNSSRVFPWLAPVSAAANRDTAGSTVLEPPAGGPLELWVLEQQSAQGPYCLQLLQPIDVSPTTGRPYRDRHKPPSASSRVPGSQLSSVAGVVSCSHALLASHDSIPSGPATALQNPVCSFGAGRPAAGQRWTFTDTPVIPVGPKSDEIMVGGDGGGNRQLTHLDRTTPTSNNSPISLLAMYKQISTGKRLSGGGGQQTNDYNGSMMVALTTLSCSRFIPHYRTAIPR